MAAAGAVLEPLAAQLEVGPLAGWAPGERRTLRVRLHNTGEARWLAARRGLGGTVLRVVMEGDAGRVVDELPWIEMPRDVDPGEDYTFEVLLRRPLGAARLQVVPRLLELGDAWWLFGAPRFEAEV